MSTEPLQADPHNAGTPVSPMHLALRILALALRAAFLAALIVIVSRVSSPQSETIWAAHETPEDLIRVALGFAACVWLLVQIFRLPEEADEYRGSLYFGFVFAPLGWMVAIIKR
jgi:TRAP-type C4-dicarboxylate transport system permease small subunit